jgi:hypothetical protein
LNRESEKNHILPISGMKDRIKISLEMISLYKMLETRSILDFRILVWTCLNILRMVLSLNMKFIYVSYTPDIHSLKEINKIF